MLQYATVCITLTLVDIVYFHGEPCREPSEVVSLNPIV